MEFVFNRNNSGKNNYIGMEIDDYEIRAIELDLSVSVPRLCNTGTIRLETGTVVEGIVKNPQALGSKLTELWTLSGFTSDRVLLAIGSQDILIRFARIQKMEDSKIKSIIRFQSQDYFPVAITDHEMDFMTLREKKDEENHEFKEIVIVASKNSHIRGYTSALEIAKLSPYEIDISSLSIMKYAEQIEPDSISIIVNISYGKLDLLILKDSIPVFAKTSLFDASSIFVEQTCTPDSGKEPEITLMPDTCNNFSEYNFIAGSAPSLPSSIGNPLYMEISSEIQSLVNYCFSLSDSEPPSVILLCGPCSRLEGLDMHILNQTMIKTIIIEPFKDILVSDDLRKSLGNSTTDFSVCASLAIRGQEV